MCSKQWIGAMRLDDFFCNRTSVDHSCSNKNMTTSMTSNIHFQLGAAVVNTRDLGTENERKPSIPECEPNPDIL